MPYLLYFSVLNHFIKSIAVPNELPILQLFNKEHIFATVKT